MMTRMTLDHFVEQAVARLEEAGRTYPWLKRHGDIIQCPASALREGEFYFMGFNPGGSGGKTLRQTIVDIASLGAAGDAPRTGKYWTSLARLANALGVDGDWRKRLFVTNLFPDNSPTTGPWKKRHPKPYAQYVDAIWPVHQLMLSIVRPRFVVVSGVGPDSAFKLLWAKLGPSRRWNDTMSKVTKDDPQIKSFSVNDLPLSKTDRLPRVTFIGVRHFSYGGPRFPRVVPKLVQSERAS